MNGSTLDSSAAHPAGAVEAAGTIRENTLPGAPSGAFGEGIVPATPGGTIREGTVPRPRASGAASSLEGRTVPGGSTSSESRGKTIPGGAGGGTNRGGVPGGIPGAGGLNNMPR